MASRFFRADPQDDLISIWAHTEQGGEPWPDDKILEESREVREAAESGADPDTVAMELGDLLFSVVNLARHLGADAEGALRQASNKFRSRFEIVEQLAGERGIDLASSSLEVLDRLWDEAKTQ